MSSNTIGKVLSAEDRAVLDDNCKRRLVPYQLRQRSAIILNWAEGLSTKDNAHESGCTPNTVLRWIARFEVGGAAGLEDLPRTGAPETWGGQWRLNLSALVTEPPPPHTSVWTYELLAEQLTKRYAAALEDQRGPSYRWVRDSLLKDELVITRVKGWLGRMGDPEVFAERAKGITDLMNREDTNRVIVCVDEKTSVQALERLLPDLPMKIGEALRREFGYIRHGVVNIQVAYRHDTGDILVDFCERNDSHTFTDFMEKVQEWVGYQDIDPILDMVHRTSQLILARGLPVRVTASSHTSHLLTPPGSTPLNSCSQL